MSETHYQGHAVLRRGRRHLSLFLLAVFLPLLVPPDAWAMLTRPALPDPDALDARLRTAALQCAPAPVVAPARTRVARPECRKQPPAPALELYRISLARPRPGVVVALIQPEPLCTRAASSAMELIRTLERNAKTPYPGVFRKAEVKVDFKTQVTSFVYDTLGRVSEKRLYPTGTALPPAVAPAETVAFTYDDLGRQDTITDARSVTQFGYDQDGRVIQVTSPEGTINYAYDPVTGRKTRTSTANSDIRYGYDELGRLATVSVHKQQGIVLTQPEVTTYAYTEVGSRESMVLPNGVTTLYSYDNLNRLTNLSHFNSTNQLLAGYTYTLAPTSQGGHYKSGGSEFLLHFKRSPELFLETVLLRPRKTVTFSRYGERCHQPA